jgi:hypothetical protein
MHLFGGHLSSWVSRDDKTNCESRDLTLQGSIRVLN